MSGNVNHKSHQLTLQKINTLESNVDKNLNIVFSSLQVLHQQIGGLETLMSMTLDQLDIPEVNEIDYTAEEFNEVYLHLIGSYFIEKATNTFYKVNLITDGWVLESKDEGSYKFTHPDHGTKVVSAKEDSEAYDALVLELRNPLTVAE